MLDTIRTELDIYRHDWHDFQTAHADAPLLTRLRPTAIGWKVDDYEAYHAAYEELRGLCEVAIETYMNDRWIAKMCLRDERLGDHIAIIKLMQRRPGSDDASGLDHLDFLIAPNDDVDVLLANERGLDWQHETNGPGEGWLSLRFGADNRREAKLKRYTVLDRVTGDVQTINHRISA